MFHYQIAMPCHVGMRYSLTCSFSFALHPSPSLSSMTGPPCSLPACTDRSAYDDATSPIPVNRLPIYVYKGQFGSVRVELQLEDSKAPQLSGRALELFRPRFNRAARSILGSPLSWDSRNGRVLGVGNKRFTFFSEKLLQAGNREGDGSSFEVQAIDHRRVW